MFIDSRLAVVVLSAFLLTCAWGWTPPTYNSTVYNAFANKTLLNPLPPILSNPYDDPNFNTTWINTVCAVRYPSPDNRSFYYLENYESPAAAEAAGAYVTHLHPCGQCSTTRDLSVYMKYSDLTEPVRICALESILNDTWALECLENIGFSYECSVIWLYDAENTRKECFDICIYDYIENVPNNLPPNSTNLNPCLQCDEDKSGPIFKVVAGRTRRDCGLASSINRPPQDIYEVTHYYY
ncbi:membrane-associated protein, putative [Bodo saltans]|uniref:Membrane-associated protein, putative n=1 Tax=Bodo saltans TaxID=75058 RepID=A0A0S4JPG9_BODSA|nr:membrane-associated protein, putative [Bodo saltans]|eukprot:CUG91846.1 membrane-associated protein, putative [Bodo saltans]